MIVEQLCLLICLLSAPCLPTVPLQEAGGGEEVASLNQFMDAVLRRMSAGLRAKLMDPMELGLQPRQAEDPRINRDNSRIGRGINKTLDKTPRGILTGLATLRRAGDVKILSCQFTVGPLLLEVSKSVSFTVYAKNIYSIIPDIAHFSSGLAAPAGCGQLPRGPGSSPPR